MLKFYLLLTLIIQVFCNQPIVPEFGDDNFQEIRQHEISVGMFYSPDCRYCKKFISHYRNTMEEMEESEPKIFFFKVNCMEEGKSTCEKEEIPAYPHVKIYIDGKFVEEYQGERRTNDFVKYLKTNFDYSSKELLNSMEVDKLLDSPHYVVLGYFEKCTGLQMAFLKASFVLKEKAKFACITSKGLLSKYGFNNTVILYKPKYLHNKFESENVTYAGHGDTEELVAFIEENYRGLVGHRTTKNENDFKPPMVIAYYNIDYKYRPKLTNYWRNRILLVANKYQNVTFATSSTFEFENELWKLGLNVSAREKPLVLASGNDVHYMMETNFSVEALDSFVSSFLSGALKPYIKSEPLPADKDDVVKILVGKNFDEIMNNGKDTFIQFYTPWCLVCLEFATIYEDLALELGDDVIIAKMNVAANDYPSFISIKTYPTFYLARKGMYDNPLLYNSTMDLQSMIKFIAEHATDELTRFDRQGNLRSKTEL